MNESSGLWSKMDRHGLPVLLARLIVAGVMIFLSIPKIQQPVHFLKLIHQYQLFQSETYWLLNIVAVVLPWIELLGGLALIGGIGRRGVGLVMLILLCTFTGIIAHRSLEMVQAGESFFKLKFDCGCGTGEQVIWLKLLENVGLILLTFWIMLSCSTRYCLFPDRPHPHDEPPASVS